MAREFRLRARIEADDKASGPIGNVEGRVKRLGKAFLAISAGAALAAAVALRKVAAAAQASVDAFKEQESAVESVRSALAPLGPEADRITESLQKFASEQQRITTFGDEQILKAQALIASFVKEEGAIKKATLASLDLAEAKGFDLVSAADLVAKSLGSSTNALTRYGIEVEGAVGSSERLNSLVENTAAVFGGRAQAAVHTYEGAIKQLSNAYGDLQEETGGSVVGNERLQESLGRLQKILVSDGLVKAFQLFGGALGSVAASGAEVLESLASLVGSFGRAAKEMEEARIKSRQLESGWEALNRQGTEIVETNENVARTHRAIFEVLDDQAKKQEEAAKAAAALRDEEERALRNRGTLANLTLDLTRAVDILNRARQRELRIEGELNALRSGSAEAIARTGIRLRSELTDELAKTSEQLENLRELERQGEISSEQFAFATRQLRIEQEALKAVLEGEASTVEQYKQVLDAAGASVGDFGEKSQNAGAQVGFLGDQFLAAERQISSLNNLIVTTSLQFDNLAASAGRAAATVAAVNGGGRTVLGGTRVQLPGGGSRLTSEPGLSTGFRTGFVGFVPAGGGFTAAPRFPIVDQNGRIEAN